MQFFRIFLRDLGFRKDVLLLSKEELIDIAGTHGICGGVVWAIGTWVPLCAHVGSVVVIIGGFAYIYAHVKAQE